MVFPVLNLITFFLDNDVTYLLSKLSDEELIKLLNEHPKKEEYDLNDIVKLAFNSKLVQDNNKYKQDVSEVRPRETFIEYENQNSPNKHRFRTVSGKTKPQIAVFRLENKQIDPYNIKSDADPNYNAIQKLSNMLYSRPSENRDEKNAEEDEKKELLFDVLVSQLRTLCCKKSKTLAKSNSNKYKTMNEYIPLNIMQPPDRTISTNEHMFLIINDELKSNGSDELISVDPDSLETNSSVLLLGPITTPLSDNQLKLVVSNIFCSVSLLY